MHRSSTSRWHARRLRSLSLRVARPVSRYAWSPASVETERDREGEEGTATVLRLVRTIRRTWYDALFRMVPSVVIGRRSAGMTYQAEGWVIAGDAHAARGMGRSSHAA